MARKDPGNVVFGTIGWLFADLMVALAMAFLVATTVGMPAPDPKSTPTKPTPTPSAQLGLENVPVEIKVSVDYQGLLNGSRLARDALLKKVKADSRITGRDAGLVLAFGGADNSAAGIDRAMKIASKANEALKTLGRTESFVFSANTAYTPYIDYGNAPSTLELRVYLFKQ
ncbi:hypothetical protein ABGB12_18080 [Actinocorallia sp. B10E7]|uniref:hypothetical protein n=1 Tax=Actinocorallia sp. B10E7 TaxID=3153558 RepID=UPI00325F626F